MPSSDLTSFIPRESFTNREREVWGLTARGFCLKEIAAELGVGRWSVVQYRKTLYSKLGVDNAVGVALAGIAYNIIDIPRPSMRISFRPKHG